MKVLIIQTAFIGDAILASDLPRALRAEHPDWQIDLLVRKGNEGLFAGFTGIRKLLVWDKKKDKYKNWWKILKEIREEEYDELINLQRFASTGLLTIFSGARRTSGYSKNPLSMFFTRRLPHQIDLHKAVHETTRNRSLIAHLVQRNDIRPILYPSTADREHCAPLQKQSYFCLAPASVWFTKQLPGDQWLLLIHELLNRYGEDSKIYLLGGAGEAERKLCASLKAKSGSAQVIDLSAQLSLLQSAVLMQSAVMNFVNDSAPMHLCSAMDAPVTVFYCSTVPGFGFGPLSRHSVIAEAKPSPPCRPCGLHGYKACPKKHFQCAHAIRVADYLPVSGGNKE